MASEMRDRLAESLLACACACVCVRRWVGVCAWWESSAFAFLFFSFFFTSLFFFFFFFLSLSEVGFFVRRCVCRDCGSDDCCALRLSNELVGNLARYHKMAKGRSESEREETENGWVGGV